MDRASELENRNICRICLTQEDDANFIDIFEASNLPMELLSIGTVEVFESDGMPRKICECCRTILGNSYKFKQICKRSDTLLKMYPMTGNIPPKITIPQELLPARAVDKSPVVKKPKTKSVGVNCDEIELPEPKETTEISTQTEEDEPMEIMELEEESYEAVIAPPAEFSEPQPKKVKIESVKILNKALSQTSTPAKQFRKPSQIKVERVEVRKPKILNSQLPPLYETVETLEDGKLKFLTFSEEDGEYLEEAEFVKGEVKDSSDDNVVYTCSVCERSFPLLQQLEIHKINHTRERNHPCDFCDKSFFTKYDLAKHVLTHTKQKDYQCVVCSKSFSRSTLLYRHEKVHADLEVPRHQCAECDRVYLNIADYEKHVLTHTKNRPFDCKLCHKRFAFKQGLERHEVIHDVKSLPNPCQYCEYRFPSAARLQRHLSQKHAGMRPFPCSKCPKRFSMSHHLYRHMRTTHSQQEITSYQCPECEEVFTDRDEFFNHAIDHSQMTMTCPLCKLVFENIDDVTEHIVVHSKSDMHFCDYCNLIYMNSDDLQAHFMDAHSDELCGVGEEIEFIVEEHLQKPLAKKRKLKNEKSSKAKDENDDYDIDEEYQEGEDFTDQYIVNDMEGASFVEYEEITEDDYEDSSKPAPSEKSSPLKSQKEEKTLLKAIKNKAPVKQAQKSIKMTRAEIEHHKKAGRIEILPNGEMRMKQ